MIEAFDRDRFRLHVEHHGFGAPTSSGYLRGEQLVADGVVYSSAAEEIVTNGLTERAIEMELEGQ